jgi:hypothetical protein
VLGRADVFAYADPGDPFPDLAITYSLRQAQFFSLTELSVDEYTLKNVQYIPFRRLEVSCWLQTVILRRSDGADYGIPRDDKPTKTAIRDPAYADQAVDIIEEDHRFSHGHIGGIQRGQGPFTIGNHYTAVGKHVANKCNRHPALSYH